MAFSSELPRRSVFSPELEEELLRVQAAELPQPQPQRSPFAAGQAPAQAQAAPEEPSGLGRFGRAVAADLAGRIFGPETRQAISPRPETQVVGAGSTLATIEPRTGRVTETFTAPERRSSRKNPLIGKRIVDRSAPSDDPRRFVDVATPQVAAQVERAIDSDPRRFQVLDIPESPTPGDLFLFTDRESGETAAVLGSDPDFERFRANSRFEVSRIPTGDTISTTTQEGDVLAIRRGQGPGGFVTAVVRGSPKRRAEAAERRAELSEQTLRAQSLLRTLVGESGRGLVGGRGIAARTFGGLAGIFSADAESAVVKALTGTDLTPTEFREFQTELRTFAIGAREVTTGEEGARLSEGERSEALRASSALGEASRLQDIAQSREAAIGAISTLTRLRIIHDTVLALEKGTQPPFPVSTPEEREETFRRLRDIFVDDNQAQKTFFRLSEIFLRSPRARSDR